MSRNEFTQAEFEDYAATVLKIREEGIITDPLPAVVISRDAGARGVLTAHALKQYLDATETDLKLPWKVFEANLVDIMLKRNSLPKALVDKMPEDKVGFLQRIRNLFEKEPSDTELFQKTESLLHELLGLGQNIIVGRGADFVGANMPHVLKVKLLVSEDTAVRRIAKDEGITRQEAAELRVRRDVARAAYVKNYYRRNYHDYRHFDLVIETDNLRVVEVAEMIGRAIRSGKKAK